MDGTGEVFVFDPSDGVVASLANATDASDGLWFDVSTSTLYVWSTTRFLLAAAHTGLWTLTLGWRIVCTVVRPGSECWLHVHCVLAVCWLLVANMYNPA